VDLGFSAKKRSTGIAVLPVGGSALEPCQFTFGAAIGYVAQAIRSSKEGVIILESPLSARFDGDGNPCPREFESRTINGRKDTRYWYSGAGAAMMLAAHFFLRELDKKLTELQHNGRIHVFEGFLSFKTADSKDKRDAERLLKRFLDLDGVRKVETKSGEKLVSVLDGLCVAEQSSAPPEIVFGDLN
jgi:hypothetical protein